MAKRHECVNRDRFPFACDMGDGAPKRKRCSHCGGDLFVSDGSWGVFDWRQDGVYVKPHATYATRRSAERLADVLYRDGGNAVVRWVPA